MRKRISTLALMAALVAVVFVSFPSEALAQYGYHYGHGHRYYGHGYRGYGGYAPYGYGEYYSNDGDVRIEVSPKYLRGRSASLCERGSRRRRGRLRWVLPATEADPWRV